jgi:hypothetical protein
MELDEACRAIDARRCIGCESMVRHNAEGPWQVRSVWRCVDWHADGALPAWRSRSTPKEADVEGWLP